MSIIKSLQSWLSRFDGMDLKPLTEISTDIVGQNPSNYALALAGDMRLSVDIVGNKTYQHSYVFYAKEAAENEIDRQDNHDFLSALEEWIEDQNDNDNLPILPGKYQSKSIEVSNAMMLDIYEDGTGLYQVQIQFTFERGK